MSNSSRPRSSFGIFVKKSRLAFLSVFFSAFICLSASAMAQTQVYYAPPSQFNAGFQVMDQGLSNVMGFFGEATGSFSYDPSKNELTKIKLAVSTAGLSTPSREAGNDLSKLLEPSLHPEIVFMSSAGGPLKNGKGEIRGTLTVHGQSQPAVFEASLNQSGKESKWVGLSLKGAFKRADFGMGDPPEIPGRFGETITLVFEMKAVGQ